MALFDRTPFSVLSVVSVIVTSDFTSIVSLTEPFFEARIDSRIPSRFEKDF